MRFRLARLCRDFFRRNRQACLCCALVVLNMLILLFVWSIQKSKEQEPILYGIVDLGGAVEEKNLAAELERRTSLFLHPKILRDALNDLVAAGQKPLRLNDEKWLSEALVVEPLEKSAFVRVRFADGAPTMQASVINAVLRAYIRHFDEVEKKRLDDWLRSLEGRNERFARIERIWEDELAKLNDPQAVSASPNLERRKKILAGGVSATKETIEKRAAQIEQIRAAMGKLPAIVEWAQAP